MAGNKATLPRTAADTCGLFSLENVRQARSRRKFSSIQLRLDLRRRKTIGRPLGRLRRGERRERRLGRFLSYEHQNHVVRRKRGRRVGRTERFLCSAARTGL